MISIPPFSIEFISQFSIISTAITIVNLGITSFIEIDKRIERLENSTETDPNQHFILPLFIQKLKKIDYTKYVKKLFVYFVIIILGFFIFEIIRNLFPIYSEVKNIIIDSNKGTEIIKIVTNNLNPVNGASKVFVLIEFILSWVQLIIILRIFSLIIILLGKYIKTLTAKAS